MPKKVLSVGQCAADHYMINLFLKSTFGVVVSAAATVPEALAHLRKHPCDLVLVNRLFDANGASGLKFIAQLKADPDLANIPVMLVSNFADAQEQAVAAGALPGFGKGALEEDSTSSRLQGVLGTQGEKTA